MQVGTKMTCACVCVLIETMQDNSTTVGEIFPIQIYIQTW